ncbi:hypothetical protein [Methylobacterium gossipiicola]|uniref:Uncharacterized protein n=1 Tax=Methylobacterium gossipiicola TaxID=582675 RepID=A0A1I2W5U5_9HYPH|nr:hypothetical protein [Methylobacterium gossipiicola]SFG96760.1 hypothetical protein SAMN05192565_12021 [Methylobacterium gossipiicola]
MALGKGGQAVLDPVHAAGATPSGHPGRAARSAPRRRGPGLLTRLFLVGSVTSFCVFALSAMMPCGGGGLPGFLPRALMDAACARRDVLEQILTLPSRLRAIAMALR